MTRQILTRIFLVLLLAAEPAAAQVARLGAPDAHDDAGWNSPRALELIGRARDRRQERSTDHDLADYQARADGYVYFFIDADGGSDRTLVKVDQLALEVYWAAPNQTRQRIIGWRDATPLPSRIHYHLDHLTVVQNEFDDRIRLGDGDEVHDVPHPAAPGADSIYDFRLVDSLTLRLPGAEGPIRVFEIEVRPRRMDRPALIGSVYIDHASAAIVRMAFTFTPASYVDARLDYIQVALDNGLWDGRHWLPHEQRLEIRRELPGLDFPAGTVIRGVYRIGDYRFNQLPPSLLFHGPSVTTLRRELRETYDFPAGLFDHVNEEGLATDADLRELRRRAARLAGRHALSGLPRLRLHIPDASSAFRYNRAEGPAIGAGASYALDATTGFELTAGYAIGPGHPRLGAAAHRDLGSGARLLLTVDHNRLGDVGLRPGDAGAVASLHAIFYGLDLLDPYSIDGAGLALRQPIGRRWTSELRLAWESHRSAERTRDTAPFDGSAFRPVRPIDDGRYALVGLSLERPAAPEAATAWSARLDLEAGRPDNGGGAFGRLVVGIDTERRSAGHALGLHARAAAGIAAGELPAQFAFAFGGRNTLPGYAYRAYGGDRFALADAVLSAKVAGPWLRARGIAALGWSDYAADAAAKADAAAPKVRTTGGALASLGVGVSLFYDILRIDRIRGLHDDGRWETVISVHPRFWSIL